MKNLLFGIGCENFFNLYLDVKIIFERLNHVRIPNHLYSQIQSIAIAHYEVTPTILELIQIGIAHIESNLPVTDELKKQIGDLDTRLKAVEGKLSGVQINNTEVISKIASNENEMTVN